MGKRKSREENSPKKKQKRALIENSPFHSLSCSLPLALPPQFSQKADEYVREVLESFLLSYIPALRSVLLSYEWPPVLYGAGDNLAKTIVPGAFSHIMVEWKGVGWRPVIGSFICEFVAL